MSLEIDWKTYKAIQDKGVSFESKGTLYLIVQGILLTVQPTQEEYGKEESKEEIDSNISSY